MAHEGNRLLLGGGIGSGKTAAASCFAALGSLIVSTDDLARSLLVPGTVETGRVIARWPEVESSPGVIDRRILGRIVFADGGLLAELEAIVHPGVAALVTAAADSHPTEVVIVEIPVLRDLPGRGWPWIVVDAPEPIRVARAAGRGVFSEAEVRQVMERQSTRSEWLAAATWVIDNSGDREQFEEQCRRVWAAIGD